MHNEYVGWIIGAVLVLAVIVGVWFIGGSPASSPTATTTPPAQTPTGSKPSGSTGGVTNPFVPAPVEKVYASGLLPINELIKLTNVTYSCTFTVATPYRAGKFYLAGQKWRGDFTNDVSMIDDGKYIYVWSKGATEGLQVVATSAVAGNALIKQGAIDAFAPLTYKCSLWAAPDTTKFSPPAGITFKNTEGYILQ